MCLWWRHGSDRSLVPLSGTWSEERESSSKLLIREAEEAWESTAGFFQSLQRFLQVLLLKASKAIDLYELGSWTLDQSRVFLSQETLKLKYRSCWQAWVWRVREERGGSVSVTVERGWTMDIDSEETKAKEVKEVQIPLGLMHWGEVAA